MRQFIFFVASVIVVSGCSSSLSGVLRNSEGRLINSRDGRVNVVRLDGKSQSTVEVLKIGKKGEFETTESLDDGKYLIEALIPGYRTASQTIVLDGSRVVNLELERLQQSRLSTIDVNTGLEVGRGPGDAQLTPPKL